MASGETIRRKLKYPKTGDAFTLASDFQTFAEELDTVALVTRGIVFPVSPKEEQEFVYEADHTNGVMWRFMYNETSGSSHKWEFVGGGDLFAEAEGEITTESEAYVALAGGPKITIPLAGDYLITLDNTASVTGPYYSIASLKLGATAANDVWGNYFYATTEAYASVSKTQKFTGLAESAVVEVQYRRAGGAGKKAGFYKRHLSLRPIRVG